MAKDIVQDLFVNLWTKRGDPLITKNLPGYLYTKMRWRILDLFAHRNVESKYITALKDFINRTNTEAADAYTIEKDFKAYVDKQVATLPHMMRTMFNMSRNEGLSYAEIAEKLGTNTNNVTKQVNNAVKLLKKRLGLMVYLVYCTQLNTDQTKKESFCKTNQHKIQFIFPGSNQ